MSNRLIWHKGEYSDYRAFSEYNIYMDKVIVRLDGIVSQSRMMMSEFIDDSGEDALEKFVAGNKYRFLYSAAKEQYLL